MITIVDYGMGNLGSVKNMLRRVGAESCFASDLDALESASKILLPGVGHFGNAMRRLKESGMSEVLSHKAVEEKVPTLGICLGMQLLCRSSEEAEEPGLGWIDAQACRFPPTTGLKVPHMGWNEVRKGEASPLTADLAEDARFYFVHSFYVRAVERSQSILTAKHGIEFDAAVQAGNIYGAQFHPEKSHRFGKALLAAFAALPC
jgi:imidazole glycerol-phosphate synthase subunit HisH